MLSPHQSLPTSDAHPTDPAAAQRHARHGFPHKLRATIWTHLLQQRADVETDNENVGYLLPIGIQDHIREDATRCYARHVVRAASNLKPTISPITQRIGGDPANRSELVALPTEARYMGLCDKAFLQLTLSQRSYNPVWAYLIMPLAVTFSEDEVVLNLFPKVVDLLHRDLASVRKRIGLLVNRFRVALPDLYYYFDEEDVDLNEMSEAWLVSYMSREMLLPDVLRLWDVLLSRPEPPADYHLYVCLGLLAVCKDAFEELDRSEARSMALSLPALDMDRVLKQADLIERGLTALD